MSAEKKEIKINYCDFWPDFNKEKNFISVRLQKKYKLVISDKPDFLIYSCFSNQHRKYKDCVKIFYTGEAITPNFNDCDYAIGFDYIDFEDRYYRHSRLVPYKKEEKDALDLGMAKRKFCNFTYYNSKTGEGAKLRQDFCKKLMNYKHIDCPGRVLNNMKKAIEPRFGNWVNGKLDFIGKYKFTIAFENCAMNGYTTEKLMHPLMANSIPIYWGNKLVSRDFNPKAFINCNDFNDLNEVIEYVKYLDTNDEAYMQMLKEPPMQENYTGRDKAFEEFLFYIIEKGNKPFNKDILNWRGRASTRSVRNIIARGLYFFSKK